MATLKKKLKVNITVDIQELLLFKKCHIFIILQQTKQKNTTKRTHKRRKQVIEHLKCTGRRQAREGRESSHGIFQTLSASYHASLM